MIGPISLAVVIWLLMIGAGIGLFLLVMKLLKGQPQPTANTVSMSELKTEMNQLLSSANQSAIEGNETLNQRLQALEEKITAIAENLPNEENKSR